MTHRHRTISLYSALPLAALLLNGCMASRPQQFANSFLPAAPVASRTSFVAPPRIEPDLYTNEKPHALDPIVAVTASDAEQRMRRADESFQAGKRLYQQGDWAGARVQFDQAIEILLNAPLDMPDRQKLDRKVESLAENIARYDLDAQAGDGAQQVVYEKAPIDSMLEMTFPTDPGLKPKVGEELHATVSQLPLDANDAVLSYIHYFSTDRGRKTLVAGLRRSGRYSALIRRILSEEGIPQELLYLAQAESGFIPYAMSNKKATGMWQFVQWRGHQYGLDQTAYSDDRLDPEKATRAAAKHLHDLYNEFGDWYLAMAAYNCGPACVEHAVERTGYADFWQLRALNALPHQTENYVPLILAMTIMAKNPKDYGLEDVDAEQPLQYDTVALNAPTSLWLVADAADYPVSEIRELNPSLLRAAAPAGYDLRVPYGTGAAVKAALARVPASNRLSWRLHRVSEGETLALIARQYQTNAGAISSANQLSATAPSYGDVLLIPAAYHPEHRVSKAARGHVSASRRRSRGSQPVALERVLNGHRRASARLSATRRARG